MRSMEVKLLFAFFLQAMVVLHQLNFAEARASLRGLEVERVPNEYLVVVRGHNGRNVEIARMNLEHLQAFIENTKIVDDGGEIRYEDKAQFLSFGVLRVYVTSQSAMDQLLDHPLVDFVETNKVVRFESPGVQNIQCKEQPTGSELWGLSRISSRVRPNYTDVAYHYDTRSGSGVDAYVIDSGVSIEHQEFEGRATRGYTSPSVHEAEGDNDTHGHGTHVAGTIAGKTTGVAKTARIIAVKIGGTSVINEMTVMQGVVWACNDFMARTAAFGKRAKGVVNMSLGSSPSEAMDLAIRLCVDEANLPFVVSGGNSRNDSCEQSPARSSSVITVGASDIEDALAWFSNYGPCVDVMAPGVDIRSAYNRSPTEYKNMSGTSMAAPHVAGAVASLLSTLDEQQNPARIKALLVEAATKNVINTVYPENASLAPNRLLYNGCTQTTDQEVMFRQPTVLRMKELTGSK